MTTDDGIHLGLTQAAQRLSRRVSRLTFGDPVTHVYNPLSYAWSLHEQYLRMARQSCRVLMLGMNPGPWGMAQTGVPFGEVSMVRDWLMIRGDVRVPRGEHPKRPILGLRCARSEVSGRRLWGLMKDEFEQPERFFQSHFIINYCPLVFMEAGGRNRTPDKLPSAERDKLESICDEHLASVLRCGAWEHVVGVGVFAERCLQRALASMGVTKSGSISCSRILHPSPASPAANQDWAGKARQQLCEAGIWS